MLYPFFKMIVSVLFFEICKDSSDFCKSKTCDEDDKEEEIQEGSFVDAGEAIAEFVVETDYDDECNNGDAECSEECFFFQ